MKTVSGKQLSKILKKQGWILRRIKGSHHIYFNPKNRKIVVVPIHGNSDLKKGTQKSIMKHAGLTDEML